MDIQTFNEIRRPSKPWTSPASRLAEILGVSLQTAKELGWAQYNLDHNHRLFTIIDPEVYFGFRNRTRLQFNEIFGDDLPAPIVVDDWPKYFKSLIAHFETNPDALANALATRKLYFTKSKLAPDLKEAILTAFGHEYYLRLNGIDLTHIKYTPNT